VSAEAGAATADGWDERFARIVRQHVRLPSDVVLASDSALTDHGLDSFAVVELILAVESEYAITMPEELFVLDTFATPGALWAAVQRLRSQAGTRADT
jgi:acyl carrier protein